MECMHNQVAACHFCPACQRSIIVSQRGGLAGLTRSNHVLMWRLTLPGRSAALIAKYKPSMPVFVVSKFEAVARQSRTLYGTHGVLATEEITKVGWDTATGYMTGPLLPLTNLTASAAIES
eukprot:scaffold19598_cov37-Prasinocladus_malaysianus.AAC.2